MRTLVGFSLLGRVGAGSSATVWKARDQTLGRLVAIKQLAAPNEQLRAQWRREAEILASLDHPNIVAVHGYREDEHGAYIIETWIEGAPLSALLNHGALSSAQALGVIRGTLLGLAHVHHHGLVHGDIAPANILLDTQGTPRLIDFGLSTGTGTSSGSATTAYASPEAQHGQPATPASDVYATAAVLAYLLRGNPTPTPTLDGVDPALHPVLTRALAENPAHRYPDAATFLHALDTDATRRYGATWWTQAGIGTLISTIPLLLLDTTETEASPQARGKGELAGAAVLPHLETAPPSDVPDAVPPSQSPSAADLVQVTPAPPARPGGDAPRNTRRRRALIGAAAAALVLATGTVIAVAATGDDAKPAAQTTTPPPTTAAAPSTPTTAAVTPSSTPSAIATPAAGGQYDVDLLITSVHSAGRVIFNGVVAAAGKHVPIFSWTISGVACAGRTCTASMVSSGKLHYTLRWDGTRWTGTSQVGHGRCYDGSGRTDNYVNTLTLVPSAGKGLSAAAFTGTFAETLTGACLTGGTSSLTGTLVLRRGCTPIATPTASTSSRLRREC